jgi:hypothetical protein
MLTTTKINAGRTVATEQPDEPSPVVFLGPTLDHWQAASLAQADFKPPAAMGDITRAVAAHASAVVLVDGTFESGPSVWHKEILYALSRGIPVIGACSMGALRAAELHSLGMYGFGDVFAKFARGELTDDDEVAVVHGPAETGWIQMSDAMVDVRAIVETAVSQGIVSQAEGELVINHAKSTYFKTRSLSDSLRAALKDIRSTEEIETIVNWNQINASSLKRHDCILLLQNLPAVVRCAKDALQRAQPLVSTTYLNRLEPYGYRTQKGTRS